MPVRIEIGPRDIVNGEVTVVRRDTGEKRSVAVGDAAATVQALLGEIQSDLLTEATAFRDAHQADAASVADDASRPPPPASPGCPGRSCGTPRRSSGAKAVTVRCIQRADGSVPATRTNPTSSPSAPAATDVARATGLLLTPRACARYSRPARSSFPVRKRGPRAHASFMSEPSGRAERSSTVAKTDVVRTMVEPLAAAVDADVYDVTFAGGKLVGRHQPPGRHRPRHAGRHQP